MYNCKQQITVHWIDFKRHYKRKRLHLHFTLTNRGNPHRITIQSDCVGRVNTFAVFITTKNRERMKTAQCKSKWHSLQFQRTKIAYGNHKIVLFPQEFNTCWLYKLRDPSSQTALISSQSLLGSRYVMSCNWCCQNCPAGHMIRMCVHSLLGSYETCASPTTRTSLAWYVGVTVKSSWAHNTSGVESGIMLLK